MMSRFPVVRQDARVFRVLAPNPGTHILMETHMLKKALIAATAVVLLSGTGWAQSVGNSGHPARANTTDPNSAPTSTMGHRRMEHGRDGPRSGTVGMDATGRANTSDPNSAMSGGTDASGRPINPMANPRRR